MIKQLIADLAYDKITLSQALTRAKIISYRLKYEIFADWLNKELIGYDYDDHKLPTYRKVRCNVSIEIGGNDIAVLVDTENEAFNDSVWFHRFVEPISIIEKHVSSLKTPYGDIRLTPEQYIALFKILTESNRSYRIYQSQLTGGYKKIAKTQMNNIIELTKQKLLDTLLQLDSEFPKFENEFDMSKENIDKVQNIITNNIYGNNNPVNTAAGQIVEQREIKNILNEIDYGKLQELGVDQQDIQELKEIVQTSDKSTIKDKSIKWLSSVSASVAAKGFYENLPGIIDFIHRITG